jgi:hypothetical protein
VRRCRRFRRSRLVAGLDLLGNALLGDPEHHLEPTERRQVLGSGDQILDEIRVEVALAKRRGIAVVEQLLDGVEADVDAARPVLEPVPMMLGHGQVWPTRDRETLRHGHFHALR